MQHVLSNSDLVRHLLKQSSHAAPILAVNHTVRDSESCARYYAQWARRGCPTDAPPRSEEGACLAAIGRHSTFCTGKFNVSEATPDGSIIHTADVPVATFADRVRAILDTYEAGKGHHTLVILTLGNTTLRIRVYPNTSATSQDHTVSMIGEWRFKGGACRMTRHSVDDLVRSVCITTGNVSVHCPVNTNVRGPIAVPRSIRVHVSRVDDATSVEQLLLSAARE